MPNSSKRDNSNHLYNAKVEGLGTYDIGSYRLPSAEPGKKISKLVVGSEWLKGYPLFTIIP